MRVVPNGFGSFLTTSGLSNPEMIKSSPYETNKLLEGRLLENADEPI